MRPTETHQVVGECLTFNQAERPHAKELLESSIVLAKCRELSIPYDPTPEHAGGGGGGGGPGGGGGDGFRRRASSEKGPGGK